MHQVFRNSHVNIAAPDCDEPGLFHARNFYGCSNGGSFLLARYRSDRTNTVLGHHVWRAIPSEYWNGFTVQERMSAGAPNQVQYTSPNHLPGLHLANRLPTISSNHGLSTCTNCRCCIHHPQSTAGSIARIASTRSGYRNGSS